MRYRSFIGLAAAAVCSMVALHVACTAPSGGGDGGGNDNASNANGNDNQADNGNANGSSAPPAEEGVTDVSMQGIAFVPKEVTIKQGEKVRWTNHESLPIVHTTTSGDPSDANAGGLWNSGDLSPGESFVRQFDDVGQFEYYCIHHQNTAAMRHAMVIVEP